MGLEQLTYFQGDKPGSPPDPTIYTGKALDKVQQAIELLQAWEPVEGYYLADSGGKDSCVARDLLIKSGVKFDAHYNVSPIDPKPVQDFLKLYHPDTIWNYHAKGFWKLVIQNDLPLRQQRWCCKIIKESGGNDRVVVVGNRRSESNNRKNQCFIEQQHYSKVHKTVIRPIINFTDKDVWSYIRTYNVPYCYLYDECADHKGYGEGLFKRLGCVLCPFNSNTKLEIQYFPKIVNLWKLACDKIVAEQKARGYKSKKGKDLKRKFQSGQELFDWWVDRKPTKKIQQEKLF
jgi:phosphoadenosine phosphosulfate reductase